MTSEEMQKLEDELEANERDAKRYRWVRDHCNDIENPAHAWIVEAPADLWDDAIDNAMKETTDAI